MTSSSEPSKALITRRAEDAALMPPPPPRKRIKRPATVIDEDDYTDALSHIIARDFFPGLLETQSQQEYLDALESRDREWITEAGRKLTQVMTPGPDGRRARGRRGTSLATPRIAQGTETPRGWGGDTPVSIASDATSVTEIEKKPEVDTNMSLSSFQAKYTSEDNESFNKLLDKQNEKRAQKYAWLWHDNKIPAPRQIAHRQREQKLLEEWKARESEDGKSQLEITAPDDRPAKPDAWKSRPENQLMFKPDSIEDTHKTVQQAAEEASKAGPKAVIYDNTRLQLHPISADGPRLGSVPPSPSLSAVQDAICGRPRATSTEPGFSGTATPRVNGYAFVDPEPTPAPSNLSDSSWNDYSPLRLGGPIDTTPNPFKIKDKSRREDLHHRMVERVAKNKRKSTPQLGSSPNTPVPKFTSQTRVNPGNLTPAAQRLLSKVGTPSGSPKGLGGLFDGRTPKLKESGLRHRWTPTPKSNR
ncbi:hypothetical protein L228DRAFT_267988 [Xylona heveae TC161]|uniref:Nuclear protein DGCR14 n=1 Tax=Xylona heveae (strain CBS 132557 / TC161) TaxID=1328760 RepID=A0A165GU42_XYLHT|nr:hypothetical protein L228DRAFT_267988 [Xylona heveae TC161]KZF22600.1 hypothetical protein L228DRAFT_267988 [Xylona heveae TC161]